MMTNTNRLRRLIPVLAFGFLLVSCGASREASFFVEGKCQACESLIREAVEEVSGAELIRWDTLSNQALVQFRGDWTLLDTIQAAVADAGFNTQFYPANEDHRADLPECCLKSSSRLMPPGGLPEGHP